MKRLERPYSDISKGLFKAGNVQSAILRKTILDSVWRVAGYSGDIAEIAINMSSEAGD